jgi:predicted transcriptional regulator
MIRELAAISDSLQARRPVEPVSVRTFLSWFGAQRRGWQIVHQIREQLAEADLVTIPNFESRWIDAPIEFQLRTALREVAHAAADTRDIPADGTTADDALIAPAEPVVSWVSKDPTYRISKLAAANGGVTIVNPKATLSEAVTLMMARDFSQLPVMTGERTVLGIISWKSIGSRLALRRSADAVGTDVVEGLMEQAHEVRADTSIFEAISVIVQNDYVLIRGEGNKITGIVTASDLSLQFRALTEPFLLLSEIENLVRNMIGDRFLPTELSSARDPDSRDREVRSVADLTFGEYIRLLEDPERWTRLQLAIDRVLFCKNLDRIRTIRNDVTHFDPDGITPADLDTLRHFTNFLKQVEAIRAG